MFARCATPLRRSRSALVCVASSITDVEISTLSYDIYVTDNGEPGTADHIEITTDAGFAAAGVLGSGNLQVHRGL